METLTDIFEGLCKVIPQEWSAFEKTNLLPCVQDAVQFIAVAMTLIINKPGTQITLHSSL